MNPFSYLLTRLVSVDLSTTQLTSPAPRLPPRRRPPPSPRQPRSPHKHPLHLRLPQISIFCKHRHHLHSPSQRPSLNRIRACKSPSFSLKPFQVYWSLCFRIAKRRLHVFSVHSAPPTTFPVPQEHPSPQIFAYENARSRLSGRFNLTILVKSCPRSDSLQESSLGQTATSALNPLVSSLLPTPVPPLIVNYTKTTFLTSTAPLHRFTHHLLRLPIPHRIRH